MPTEAVRATKETFRVELERLVANFAANEAELTSPGYTEMQARTQFITPFFRALGWDVENRAAKPYREMEVLEETGPGEGRPDYTFRIGTIPKFFVEAKAPHEHLGSERHVLQVKRYAWSTKEVFAAILTDFEEFRFYDASQEPDVNHPHRGELINLTYKQYLANLDKLWEFSRQRVAEGSIEARHTVASYLYNGSPIARPPSITPRPFAARGYRAGADLKTFVTKPRCTSAKLIYRGG